jgi:hypothetical protein
MTLSWKLLYASVAGTSHERRLEPCQDYALARAVSTDNGEVLVITCADGAGSRAHSSIGSKLACIHFLRLASASIENGLPLNRVDAQVILQWHETVRGYLSLEAALMNCSLKDFGCTLLTAIVGDGVAAFSQIGDGAIVLRDSDRFEYVFWPQSGEYANTTYFLTDENYLTQIATEIREAQIDEIAMLTDGLQSLALHYATRTVHAPFFEPLFRSLRESSSPDLLETPFRQFLNSSLLNSRTDDDKTLILASRQPSANEPI